MEWGKLTAIKPRSIGPLNFSRVSSHDGDAARLNRLFGLTEFTLIPPAASTAPECAPQADSVFPQSLGNGFRSHPDRRLLAGRTQFRCPGRPLEIRSLSPTASASSQMAKSNIRSRNVITVHHKPGQSDTWIEQVHSSTHVAVRRTRTNNWPSLEQPCLSKALPPVQWGAAFARAHS